MSAIALENLHNRTIEVEVEIDRQRRWFRGVGCYSHCPDMGWVLAIAVRDTPSGFTILLAESQWRGEIRRSGVPQFEYSICLTPKDEFRNHAEAH